MIWLLAIDPGARAGAALFLGEVLIDSWQVRPGGEAAIVAEAVVRAEGEPLVIVTEKWSLGGRRQGEGHGHIGMLAGLGVAWGRWHAALLGAGVSDSHVVKVYPRTWQAAVLSGRVHKRATTLQLAKARGRALAHRDVGEDEACAICIGVWGTRALEVRAALTLAEGKRLGINVAAAREVVAAAKRAKREKRRKAA